MKFLTPERLAELTDALPAAAPHDVDFVWATHDSPLGPLMLVTHQDALVRVAFAVEDFDGIVEELSRKWGTRALRSSATTDTTRRQLDEYFEGRRRTFDVSHSFELTSPGFRRRVQEHLHEVAFGTTASYTQLAELAGNPKAVRAVGTACSSNPLPIVVPCHRIVRSDGSFGNYLGGRAAKQFLLKHEGAVAAGQGPGASDETGSQA